MFCYPPIFVFYRMPFAAIQVFYVELAEHVIHKFGFIACFVTIQVKCIPTMQVRQNDNLSQ